MFIPEEKWGAATACQASRGSVSLGSFLSAVRQPSGAHPWLGRWVVTALEILMAQQVQCGAWASAVSETFWVILMSPRGAESERAGSCPWPCWLVLDNGVYLLRLA